ncbi:hypothetical protein Tco_0453105 [Tanacetum coccineum]
MAALKYRDEHNKVGFLEKSKGSTDYDQVIDFLLYFHIRYAIVSDPLIHDSLVKQFWSTASLLLSESGPSAIVATIDGTPYTITQSLVRSSLLLDDAGGIVDMTIAEIYTGMDNLGYPSEGKLTIHKNKFLPQWRFLIHTLLHCLSTKSGSWDQFGSPLATALICLCEGRKFNWFSYIFNRMVNNIQNSNKFLMYPRFLQMILNIETRNTKPYKALRLTNKMFANMRLNFYRDLKPLLASMLAPAQPAIAGDSSGEAEPSVPPNVPETVTETVHSHAQVSTPPRPAPTNTDAQVNKQGPLSDPNFESTSTQAHASIPGPVPSTNVEDESRGGTFFTTPPWSPAAPPKGTTSRGATDPHNLIALCTLVCEQGKNIKHLESELQAHKLMFKEVMGKLVKRVKFLETKIKVRGRNVFVSESDDEEAEEQDVDPLIKLAKATTTAADTSFIHANNNQTADIPPGSSTPTTAFGSETDVPTGPSFESSAAPFKKGKYPMVEEDPPIKKRSFRQLKEDKLGAEATKKLYEEEHAELAREQEERHRQEDVLNSTKYYTDDDWIHIMRQVHANQELTIDLLGLDVTEENIAERMVKVITDRRRQFETQRLIEKRNKPMTYAQQKNFMRTYVKNQSSVIYSTGWTLKHVKYFSDATLQEEFNRITHAVENLQTQTLRRSIKRPGADLDQPTSRKSKSNEAQHTSIPPASSPSIAGVPLTAGVSPTKPSDAAPFVGVPQMSSAAIPPTATLPPSGFSTPPNVPSVEPTTHSYGTRRRSLGVRKKQLGRKGVHTLHSTIPIEDGDPEAEHKVCIKYASDEDSSDDDDTSVNFYAIMDWELLPTGLGWINVIYRKDNSRKCFTSLREILHLVSRADLMIIYGRVVTYYQDKLAEGVGLVLWGDLKVLIDSPEVNDGVSSDSQPYQEDDQLEIGHKQEGNALTTAVQLIAFLKKQVSDSRRPKILSSCYGIHCCCWSAQVQVIAAVFVAVSILKALKTKDLSRKLEVNYVKFQFRGGLLVTAGTSTNESLDASYFDSPSKQMGNDDPKSIYENLKENKDGSYDESIGKEKSEDASSTKQDNTVDQPVNIASPGLNTSGIGLNTIGSSINTATPEDMVGPSHSLEATHDEFLNDEGELDVDLGNIPKSYAVHTLLIQEST